MEISIFLIFLEGGVTPYQSDHSPIRLMMLSSDICTFKYTTNIHTDEFPVNCTLIFPTKATCLLITNSHQVIDQSYFCPIAPFQGAET